MAQNPQIINVNDAIKGWAEVAVDRFHEALDKYEVGKLDGALWRSIAYELVQAGGNIEKVVLKFKMYGRFVDMGVGRGVPIGKRGSEAFAAARQQNGRLHRYGRKKKPWYSKTKGREVAYLRLILVRDYGANTLATIESTFNRPETINPL